MMLFCILRFKNDNKKSKENDKCIIKPDMILNLRIDQGGV